jgi:hypothetical protein
MEADWEFEIGGDAPVIEACWPGYVDLRRAPEQARHLTEAADLPALVDALVKLNAAASPVWTSKCDVWPAVDSADFDLDELDAPPGSATHAMGCYIDILPTSEHQREQQWSTPPAAAAACKHICGILHAVPLRCCRVDLIIRRAFITLDCDDLGITAYMTACGASHADAVRALGDTLAVFADALCGHSTLQ